MPQRARLDENAIGPPRQGVRLHACWFLLVFTRLGTVAPPQEPHRGPDEEPRFVFPCDDYAKGLRGRGNFGVRVRSPGTPFHGTWHLAEDVWLKAGTDVRSIADGIVRYSAFSPTWTDDRGHVHWNLGNVIVIEHALEPPIDTMHAICSFYMHLASDRRVQVGDSVTRGQVIGRIGADRSEENGRYPVHLHFGIHRGPYVQLTTTCVRELQEAANSKDGLRFGPDVYRGELELTLQGTSVLVRSKDVRRPAVLSLLVGSTAPRDPSPDIMNWCQGYGAKATVEEWLRPSTFLRTGSK
ncbi:MAG: M23 family metallopeptidase [Planctomycetes bacterium]|nr:M23 family metallopeptidase [Planctomycetota bacterium]